MNSLHNNNPSPVLSSPSVPGLLVFSLNRNSLSFNSWSIPIPESHTLISIKCSLRQTASTLTFPPGRVNLIAFETRFRKIESNIWLSTLTSISSGIEITISTPFFLAASDKTSIQSLTFSFSLSFSGIKSRPPRLSRDHSRRFSRRL